MVGYVRSRAIDNGRPKLPLCSVLSQFQNARASISVTLSSAIPFTCLELAPYSDWGVPSEPRSPPQLSPIPVVVARLAADAFLVSRSAILPPRHFSIEDPENAGQLLRMPRLSARDGCRFGDGQARAVAA
jgi:hypothetical protein